MWIDEAASLRTALEAGRANELLMFSSDYPHWDYDDPKRVLARIPRGIRSSVAATNALDFYGLPPTRTADEHAN